MKFYLNKLAADSIVTNKSFWKFIKPFLKNKSCHAQNDIMLIQNDEVAYRENYSTQHVLTRLVKVWKTHLDNNEVVRGVLMDLSKAFDCIPHDLLIAKFSAYGFAKTALKYIYSYLKKR